MKWVSNPKEVCKHISTLCMTAFLACITVFNMLPSQLQMALTPFDLKMGAYALIGLGLVGKFIDQNPGTKS